MGAGKVRQQVSIIFEVAAGVEQELLTDYRMQKMLASAFPGYSVRLSFYQYTLDRREESDAG